MSRRVVITGVGAVSALGVGAKALWDGLCAGTCGIAAPTLFDASGFPTKLAGEVKAPDAPPASFSAKDYVPKSYRKAVKVMARDTDLAVAAAKLAIEDAGLITRGSLDGAAGQTTYPGERVGCQIGAGLINAETDELSAALATATNESGQFEYWRWGTIATEKHPAGVGGMNNLQPLWMLKYLPNMLACHVTIIHGCEGPSNTITCAEASVLLSVGEGMRVIQRDAADVCFSGGAESKTNLMGTLRWTLLKHLTPCEANADPASLVKPYDPASKGTILGEGGGMFVIEEASKAAARGAKPYCELAGFGASHSPPPGYEAIRTRSRLSSDEKPHDGIVYAIEAALGDAKVNPSEIDAIVPYASGIAHVDANEAAALRQVFGSRLKDIPLITVVPNTGAAVAGVGGLQLAAGAMAVREQRLPARIHAGSCPSDMQAGPVSARAASLRCVLVVTSALGGQNAALVLKKV